MVLAIEPGIYWPGGGGLRLEDNFLLTETGNENSVPTQTISVWQEGSLWETCRMFGR